MADVPESIEVAESGFTLPTSEVLTGRGFITGKSGSGKSVVEGTVVYTEDGRKRIEDVNAGEKVLSLNKHDYQQEFREVLATIEHEADELLRITLEDGTEVVGTADHSFLTVEGHEIVPIRGDELEVGTWFPLARELPSPETVTRIDLATHIASATDVDRHDDGSRRDQRPGERYLELDFEAGRVVGRYLADGSVDSRFAGRIAGAGGGVEPLHVDHGEAGTDRTDTLARRPFDAFVRAEFGGGPAGTAIPDWVFDAPEEFRAGLLSGYLDAAGTVGETVTVESTSPRLAAGIKELLGQFRVPATVRDAVGGDENDERRPRRLHVDTEGIGRLDDVIELGVEHEADALDRLVAGRPAGGSDDPNPTDTAPAFGPGSAHDARDRERADRASGPGARSVSTWRHPRDRPAGQGLDRRIEDGTGFGSRGKRFGRSDIRWKRVVEIEPLHERRTVYDLDVRLNDNFIANGVFVHNSNTASVIAEELLEHGLPLLVVDTDGEYYGLKSQYELLHVGAEDDCDAVVGVEHAEKLAELALLQNVPIVLDLSGFVEESERRELVRRVVERLFELGKQARKPFLVFVEEIHEFLPETGKVDDLANTLIKVAKRGRKRGIGLCGMSQRPAAVDKDFITQCDWIVWHRLTWENDKRVVAQMLGSEAAADVDELLDGEALLMTDWDDRINRIRFRRKRTFDAGATPDLDDLDAGGYAPVRSALLTELAGDETDLESVDFEELASGRRQPSPTTEPDRSDQAPEAAPERPAVDKIDAGAAGDSELEASPAEPVDERATDVVTVPNRPTYVPPELADDEPFDPVWELGHLTVYLYATLVRGVARLVGVLGRLIGHLLAAVMRLERLVRRDVDRVSRVTRRRLLIPTVRTLQDIAAYRLPDRFVAAVAVVLLALALILLLVN